MDNKQKIKELEEFVRRVYRQDKSTIYKYGEARPDGVRPGKGARFLTPKELAQDLIYRHDIKSDEAKL